MKKFVFVYDDESRVSATSRRRGIDPKLSLQDEHVCRFCGVIFDGVVSLFSAAVHTTLRSVSCMSTPCDLGKRVNVQLFAATFISCRAPTLSASIFAGDDSFVV